MKQISQNTGRTVRAHQVTVGIINTVTLSAWAAMRAHWVMPELKSRFWIKNFFIFSIKVVRRSFKLSAARLTIPSLFSKAASINTTSTSCKCRRRSMLSKKANQSL